MTVSATTRTAGPFAGNGVSVNFVFGFKVFAAADVRVQLTSAAGVVTTAALTTDYSVTLNSDQNVAPGGTVVLNVAPANGVSISLTGRTPNAQTATLGNLGGFYPAVVEAALDRSVMLVQQLAELQSRSIVSPTPDGVALVLPSVAQRAGYSLGFDAATGAPTLGPTLASLAIVASLAAGATTLALPGQNVVQTFAAMTALLKANLSDGASVLALGSVSRVDGLGGVFVWDAASVLAADGINTLAANEGGIGRWRRAAAPAGTAFASITVSGAGSIGGNLIVFGLITVAGATIAGPANVTGGFTGTTGSFSSTLSVAGAASLASLGVVGAASVGGLTVINASTFNGKATVNAAAATTSVAVTFAATTVIDLATSNVFRGTIGANVATLTLNNPTDGQSILIRITQDGTGSRTIAWPASFKWAAGAAPVLSTTAGRVDWLSLTYMADTGFYYASLDKFVS